MKIAVTSSGPGLDDALDPRFGRSPYFLVVDTETMAFEAVENPFVEAPGGAGIQAGQLVASKRAKVVLTGSCGPNAFQTLSAAGVEIVTGSTGTVRSAVMDYVAGQGAQAADKPNVPPHFGMGGGPGASSGGSAFGQGQGPGSMGQGRGGGMGRGMGRGMGQGMGRGMGRGMGQGQGQGRGMGQGMGRGMGRGSTGFTGPAAESDMDALKNEARLLREQLEKINAKIAEIEGSGGKERS
ncbi:MAG: NifB/NifX family molybdenum-iron cluster-binding protein [Candidatus Aminicenantes bacterium]|nr:NifB/NifX family molybdenum-iron cluster-binding protein [Candidatus Aminicenantes bacterium]